MQEQIAALVDIYNSGIAAAQVIGDGDMMAGETPERVAAHQQLETSRRQFADHLEVYATKLAVEQTGNNLPPQAAIKAAKQAIYAQFQAAIR